jgi:crossover junction endodeoxyribonuclease RuvC
MSPVGADVRRRAARFTRSFRLVTSAPTIQGGSWGAPVGDELLDFRRRVCHSAPVGLTLQQFEQLKTRVGRPRRVPASVLDSGLPSAPTSPVIILGIDPSLRGTGYGVIRTGRPHPVVLAQGTVHCPAGWPRSRCLAKIAEIIRAAVRLHRPAVCVVEGLFYAQNLQTALVMGEARGAALVAAAEAGLEIFEIAPRKVKQAIVGYGGAQKIAVAKMVQRMLNLPEPPAPDAADALALALTYAQEAGRYRLTAPRRI